MTGPYDDIIDLPHHVSGRYPRMQLIDRAAQFSPFAALTGYEQAIKEAARQTERKITLSEEEIAVLGDKLRRLAEISKQRPVVSVTYFVPDERKSGGAYVTLTGCLKRVSEFEQTVLFTDGRSVPIGDILEIDWEDKQIDEGGAQWPDEDRKF